jgi:hypothetical protein
VLEVCQVELVPSFPVQPTVPTTDTAVMYPRVIWAVTLSLVLASCAASSDASPAVVDDAQTPVSSTSLSPDTVPVSIPDLEVFIAAVNEAAVGTSYEDAALDDPEVFIGVGQLFCELLEEGLTVDAVLTEYLTALEDEETGAVADDDALMTGVLMGVSLEILCPEHKPEDT